MAIPTQSEMFGVVLRVMGDGIDRGWRDVQDDVARETGLTQQEMEESTPSGVATYKSRLGSFSFASSRLGRSHFQRCLSDKCRRFEHALRKTG